MTYRDLLYNYCVAQHFLFHSQNHSAILFYLSQNCPWSSSQALYNISCHTALPSIGKCRYMKCVTPQTYQTLCNSLSLAIYRIATKSIMRKNWDYVYGIWLFLFVLRVMMLFLYTTSSCHPSVHCIILDRVVICLCAALICIKLYLYCLDFHIFT